jgi:archaellum component FlaG (FlaF/FlaG flagellin family)
VKEGSTVHDTDTTTFKVKDCEQKPCKVWIEIIDKYCYGYALYVDGKYKFTEGQDGTPDGYCRFDVTPGTHKFELSKDRCSVSKSWYCQCGTYYSWVSMNDMYPHWCDCNKKPDLIIKDISWSPNSPDKGDTIKFTVKIKNQGSGSAGSSTVKYYIDGSYVGSDSVSKLSAGSTSTETFTWTASKCGDLKVKAVADANNDVYESSGKNNDRTETVSIKCPTLKPDLIIKDISWSPSSPDKGDTIKFTVKIKNQGSGSAGSSTVKYYIDGSYADYDSVSKLSAGSTSTETFTWTADKCGDVKVKAVADANKDVTETSENNNDRTETVSIPCLPSDIVIEDIDWEPSNIVAGDPVTIKVIVKNKGEGKYISRGDVLFDIQAIDENNLIYGCAINERKKIYRDIGDLEAGETKTLSFSFIFNIPYLAESLCIEMDDVHDGIRYNNKKWAPIDPQVQHRKDKFDECMRDGVLICLGGSSKLKPFLEAAGNVETAIDLTFNGGLLFDELTEDLRAGKPGDFFSDIAKYVVSIINLGEYDNAIMKTINFFNIFKHIVDTGLSCAHVLQFYVDILEGWIRGGNSCGIESSGVVGASPIYILVEDEYGKEAGYDQSGTKKEEIAGSLVFTCDHFKTVLIPGKLDNKKITVVGYDREDVEPGKTISLASEGETDSSFTLSIVESSKTIIYEDVPVNPQTIGTIEINEYNPEYYLDLDYDGDGTTDNKVKPSSIKKIRQTSHTIQLHTGWNLISLPLMPADTDVLDVMNSVAGNWNSVWSYEAGNWKRYDLTGPDFLNDLTTIEPGKGYWIDMKSEDALSVSGSESTAKSISFSASWNLVGYNSLNSMPTTSVMSSVDGNWNSVWSYENGNWKRYDLTGPDFLNDLITMEPGKGYWIDMKSSDIWSLGA